MDHNNEKDKMIRLAVPVAADHLMTFLLDQMDPLGSQADLELVCEDGFIPLHRHVLMGSSTLVRDMLIDRDPSEKATIHLPEVKLSHAVQVLSMVYSGKTLINGPDQIPVFSLLKMLGICTKNIEFRQPKTTDNGSDFSPRLRYYPNLPEASSTCDLSPIEQPASGLYTIERVSTDTEIELMEQERREEGKGELPPQKIKSGRKPRNNFSNASVSNGDIRDAETQIIPVPDVRVTRHSSRTSVPRFPGKAEAKPKRGKQKKPKVIQGEQVQRLVIVCTPGLKEEVEVEASAESQSRGAVNMDHGNQPPRYDQQFETYNEPTDEEEEPMGNGNSNNGNENDHGRKLEEPLPIVITRSKTDKEAEDFWYIKLRNLGKSSPAPSSLVVGERSENGDEDEDDEDVEFNSVIDNFSSDLGGSRRGSSDSKRSAGDDPEATGEEYASASAASNNPVQTTAQVQSFSRRSSDAKSYGEFSEGGGPFVLPPKKVKSRKRRGRPGKRHKTENLAVDGGYSGTGTDGDSTDVQRQGKRGKTEKIADGGRLETVWMNANVKENPAAASSTAPPNIFNGSEKNSVRRTTFFEEDAFDQPETAKNPTAFIGTRVIDGILHAMYCLNGDMKKTIAIPHAEDGRVAPYNL